MLNAHKAPCCIAARSDRLDLAVHLGDAAFELRLLALDLRQQAPHRQRQLVTPIGQNPGVRPRMSRWQSITTAPVWRPSPLRRQPKAILRSKTGHVRSARSQPSASREPDPMPRACRAIFLPKGIRSSRSRDPIDKCAISTAKPTAWLPRAPPVQCWPGKLSPNPRRTACESR